MKRIPPTGVLPRMACARVYHFIRKIIEDECAYRRDRETILHYWLHVVFPTEFPECADEETGEIYGEKEEVEER